MNPHEQQELLKQFETSFQDHVMSRKERSALNSTMKDLILTDNEKSVVRAKLFDLARAEMNDSNYPFIISWLEEVSKLLIKSHSSEPSAQTGSYFSPGEDCRNAICSFIKNTSTSLKICVFTISDDIIGKEILAAHKRGVLVQIVTDDEKQYDRGSDIYRFREKGIEVKCDNSTAHMHHKFAISDSKSLLTGSYNWTRSAATSNQENILITNDQSAIGAFKKEFTRLWQQF